MSEHITTTDRFVDDYLLYLLARASHALSAEFHGTLRKAGVSVPVWRVLATLSGSPGETVTGLAEACLLQQPTMTKLLDRMVRDGMVKRILEPRGRTASGLRDFANWRALKGCCTPDRRSGRWWRAVRKARIFAGAARRPWQRRRPSGGNACAGHWPVLMEIGSYLLAPWADETMSTTA